MSVLSKSSSSSGVPSVVVKSEEPLLTVGQVARLLSVSKHTVYKYIWDGKLPALRFADRMVRVSPAAVSEFLSPVRS